VTTALGDQEIARFGEALRVVLRRAGNRLE
jgi:hypothetical protein